MREKGYWYLVTGFTVSALGDALGILAMEWLVYQLTGSLLAMGALVMAQQIAEFVVRLAGATLLDRVDRVKLMAWLDSFRFAAFGGVAVLATTGNLHMWHLYASAMVVGTCTALFAPAGMALLPSLVSEKDLVRCQSLLDTSMTVAMLTGPVLGGLLIHLVGPVMGIALNAGSFLLSALMLVQIRRVVGSLKHATTTKATRGYWNEMREGTAFFKKVPALFVIMLFAAIGNMTGVAISAMWVPYVQVWLHSDALMLGVLMTLNGIGAVGGGLLIAWMGDLQKRRLWMLGSILVKGSCFVLLGIATKTWMAFPIFLLLGMSGPFFGALSSGLYGRLVPAPLRGRVMSIRLLIGGSMQPVGSGLGGVVATAFGLHVLFVGAGLLAVSCAVLGMWLPQLKGIDGNLSEKAKEISEELVQSA
ncbi:MFS transporter [Tumebacillus sp. ITR2]|uniref:MFS transporter n=1 Tax=Tumebacillus amylolyticus TaxID=2801339 RepID=A0ABS1J8C7_9BACL|nr:MFS transporter [Tumebacillus amylolyticus]MBL0385903.1 MFS transporter [Tumebacillus amylolyticus]